MHIMWITIVDARLQIQINCTIIHTESFSVIFMRLRKIAKYDY